jgi:hypothetical protein
MRKFAGQGSQIVRCLRGRAPLFDAADVVARPAQKRGLGAPVGRYGNPYCPVPRTRLSVALGKRMLLSFSLLGLEDLLGRLLPEGRAGQK